LYEWFGYSENDFRKGMKVIEFVEKKDRARVRKNLGRLLTSTQLIPNEYSAVRKNGSTFQMMSISTLLTQNGKPSGFRGIHLDLTEKKKLEVVLQNTARPESLGILAGGIAHDFNNLLTGVFGYIDLANQESKDNQVSYYLSNAIGAIGRARGLTRQLLTFAKGGAPVKKVSPLFPFLQETAQFALSGAVVSSHFDVPAHLWSSEFDRNQISQVIDNIIINAQQAMPMGGIIEVIARNVSLGMKDHATLEKGDYVRISIKDCGIGIPKEIQHRVFDPFFTTKTEGHGLGLATCYSIIKRHGGCIDVDSEPGEGSTFHIYLPAVAAGTDLIGEKKNRVICKGNGVILVMDDEEVIRKTMGAMLKTLGYTAIMKKEGKEAVEFYQDELDAGRTIDGIFLDLTVPGGMGGKESVLHIRAIDPYVPVFVASGYAEDPVMANPGKHGFTASIYKPFTINELSEILEKHLKVKKK
jgi:PAS domain S-box-containing protein